jgi:hypothetical protein
MLEKIPPELSRKKLRKWVPSIMAVKYVAAQERHPPGGWLGNGLNLGLDFVHHTEKKIRGSAGEAS